MKKLMEILQTLLDFLKEYEAFYVKYKEYLERHSELLTESSEDPPPPPPPPPGHPG